ncbi:hypothetical protein CWI42_030830 [Ordospora colligata]|uniref:Metallothionein n=1 Tax=Ordospora colligata OC4 TaxID=1354746 RepID=A0A0B2UL24_9MICR|nr:uncharacterized protein M896_030540 [Ordospora colligata OC4]KHN70068.1 hypothetical protein M896_030540 [Ordospora colligata OC4]TBU16450.1 hypothetical protein CWI41_030500 [Ordospora colligata]TBU16635.1 hypothetical protein CWI40_030900 [Ordospora colligata]TBU19208.1 hypothetical protein CWI42_030830 [Ordospora colligata]
MQNMSEGTGRACRNNECVDTSCRCPPCSKEYAIKCECSKSDLQGPSLCLRNGSNGCCLCHYK